MGLCNVSCSCSSLDEAFYFPDKLTASMRSSVQGSAEGASACSAWFFVLACYKNTDLETVSEASTRAIQVANDYMRAIADRVKSLVLRLDEVCLWSQHARMENMFVLNLRIIHYLYQQALTIKGF